MITCFSTLAYLERKRIVSDSDLHNRLASPENEELQVNSEEIRKVWYNGEWYFSVIDIIAELLTCDHKRAKTYWSTLKERLRAEGNETVTNCDQLKMQAS